MTENAETPQASAVEPPPRTPRGVRVALILSLVLNVLVLGMVGGAVLRHGPRDGMPDGGEVGFGPFTEALSPEDRRALRRSFFEKMPSLREDRQQARQDFQALLDALRAPQWDEARVRDAIEAQRKRTESRIAIGVDLLIERLAAMSADERAAFASRIEDSLDRMGRKH